MAPFLGSSLKEMSMALMGRFLKKEVLEKADTFTKLSSVDPANAQNQKHPKKVDLGFAAQDTLKKISEKKTASEPRILAFKNDCVEFLSAIVSKLLEKCPLKYPLVNYLVSVVPQKLVSPSAESVAKFEKFLQILLNGNWRSAEACDEVLAQFKAFVIEMKQNHHAEFSSFKMNENRLDEFYGNYTKDAKYAKLWEVFQIIFTLSHGQAAVERGFSINNELLVENMQEKSLVASRFVYASVKSSDAHFSDISYTPRLKLNVREARMRYQVHLEEQKKLTIESKKARKRKAAEEEIH